MRSLWLLLTTIAILVAATTSNGSLFDSRVSPRIGDDVRLVLHSLGEPDLVRIVNMHMCPYSLLGWTRWNALYNVSSGVWAYESKETDGTGATLGMVVQFEDGRVTAVTHGRLNDFVGVVGGE